MTMLNNEESIELGSDEKLYFIKIDEETRKELITTLGGIKYNNVVSWNIENFMEQLKELEGDDNYE